MLHCCSEGKQEIMDVGVNKDYSKYGPCSILSNYKLIAILWWNGDA